MLARLLAENHRSVQRRRSDNFRIKPVILEFLRWILTG
jgi:hypothetical protein